MEKIKMKRRQDEKVKKRKLKTNEERKENK